MDHNASENAEPLPDHAVGGAPASMPSLLADYEHARKLAIGGQVTEAEACYQRIADRSDDLVVNALANNDLAVLVAQAGDAPRARQILERVLALDPACVEARQNLQLLNRVFSEEKPPEENCGGIGSRDRIQQGGFPNGTQSAHASPISDRSRNESGLKVAVLSFLFNWPSTGGGIVHTVELAKFLAQAGYTVEHFYVRYPEWGTGNVSAPFPVPSRPIDFDAANWRSDVIRDRVRDMVRTFDPDYVIITDSWNSKPLLAEAVSGYPYILRFQAMECLCPLNNVRLLPPVNGRFDQCRLNQLSHPEDCQSCLGQQSQQSGSLHQAEREISGVSAPDYHERLLAAFRNAEAVFVVNPLMEAIVAPYCRQVRVATAGMDPARFSLPEASSIDARSRRTRLMFAGLIEEGLKGFHVLQEACARLWQKRQDFELVATGDPVGQVNEFTRFIGWQSQEDLPKHLADCDILMMPTVAQEALGRTAVEAMAAGRPVIASRLGGLAFTVRDGETGLLCQPGDADDLARKIETLLDHPELRDQLGRAGRRCFEREYAWEGIIERHYRPILSRRKSTRSAATQPTEEKSTYPIPEPRRETTNEPNGNVRLSLIVTALESYEVVRRQLRHFNGLLPPDCELILIDDGSRPSLETVCDSVERDYAFRLLLTHDFRQWTQPRARNQAAALAQGEKILFFDIDHIITPEIIEAARQFTGDRMFWVRKPGILDERGQVIRDPVILRGHGVTEGLAEIHPNSFVIRRALFETLGGYDERFCGSYGGDDVDFNERYARLVELRLAKAPAVRGEGYVYPDPSFNGGRTFHSLDRTVGTREPVLS